MSATIAPQSVTETESDRFARWRRPAFLLLVALLALPALAPLLTEGFPTTSDGELHLMRLAMLDTEIGRGHLYPRWMADLFLGYGYPLFNFYGPAVYYVAEALHLLGLDYAAAYVITVSLLIIGGGWGMFLLAEDFWKDDEQSGQWPALLSAVAYLYAPYLLTNAYIRGAIAELGAQALLPWIFWSFRRLLMDERPQRYALIAAFSLAALAVTHTITLLFLPLALLIYIAVLSWWQRSASRFSRQSLLWVLISGAAAIGMSAFFWLPLIGERGELVRLAYEVQHLPEHVWTWRTFVQWRVPHIYRPTIPFRLGAVQLGLALLGLILVRQRSLEWWFWLGLALVGMIGISKPVLILWQSIELLQIAQFPWRLLTFISLSLALLSGGLVARWRSPTGRIVTSILTLAVVMIAQRPDVTGLDMTALADITITPANIAHYEVDQNAYGASWTKEFLPREAEGFSNTPALAAEPLAPLTVDLRKATTQAIEVAVSANQATPFYMSQFHFPGWQAWLDGNAITVAPSTLQGLLTVEIPPGKHTLRIAWGDTPLRTAGAWISLASLLFFGVALWWVGRRRIAALIPWAMAGLALFVILSPERGPPLQTLAEPLSVGELDLLGYSVEQSGAEMLLIYPYWHVRGGASASAWRWTLVDREDNVVTEEESQPWYGVSSAANWRANTVVRDGVQLTLPPDTPAGRYRLQFRDAENAFAVGDIVIGANTPPAGKRLGVEFVAPVGEDRVALDRVEFAVNGRPVPFDLNEPRLGTTVKPGDRLHYTLHWRAAGPVSEDYHSFIHLVDSQGQVLTGHDQMPGTDLNPPRLWNRHYPQSDTFTLRVPKAATSGVYSPQVGLYSFEDGRRLQAVAADGAALGDGLNLPALKVVNSTRARPDHKVGAEFDGIGRLLGYSMDLPKNELVSGESFTVTLIYRADGQTGTDYTQFVHLYNEQSGLAAQVDEQPQSGDNPTSSWTQDEVIIAPVHLTVADDTQPGQYQLRVGLYDAQSGGARATVRDGDGQLLTDNQVFLTELTISETNLP